jgi:hypothetical protein
MSKSKAAGTATQYLVIIRIETLGPRGGKRAPVFQNYVVCAESREDALAAFSTEMPEFVDQIHACVAAECRVMRAA